ncbi:MAG: deoxyguanosinetriphosphate triphosphohydrolase [Rhodospirillales bacterium]|nr:deoxyguanosinetriphosphate triphosphohydrolase [Rhodospirillales bacterium]
MIQTRENHVLAAQAAGRAPYASDPARSRGRLYAEPESLTRTVFQRDRDRIIHSGAFRKLQYKTQVFVYHEGDYYRTRLTHSIEVGQIARSVARVLRVDEDLAEAVALAHDLGHTPFGHAGEHALDACMRDYGGFNHNDQALRIVTRLEERYAAFNGLNLSWEALDGLVKHNGPLLPLPDGKLLPITINAFQHELDLELSTFAGIEAQVAALSDDIAYNTHDIEDGIRAGFFTLDELADLPLVGDIIQEVTGRYPDLDSGRAIHETTRRLIDRLVRDLVTETEMRLAKLAPGSAEDIRKAKLPVIALSEGVSIAEKALRHFLNTRLYHDYRVNRMTSKARRIVADLFDQFMAEPNTLPTEWQVRIGGDDPSGARPRVIADYIAGMTDRFAIAEHQRFFDFHEP